jgi:hypothetical protein
MHFVHGYDAYYFHVECFGAIVSSKSSAQDVVAEPRNIGISRQVSFILEKSSPVYREEFGR